MVNSSNMDFVLVFPLIFAFLSTGQSSPEDTEQKCYDMCPPGYHKVGNCDNAKYRCAKCGDRTYTAIENSIEKCLACGSCSNLEVEIKPCHFNSNVKCDCKMGYYKENLPPKSRQCRTCKRKACSEIPECKRTCFSTTFPPSTNISTAATTSASTSTRNEAPSEESNPDVNPVLLNELPWLFLVVFLVILLVLLLLQLLFAMNTFRYPDSCLCWSANKDLELPVEHRNCNEQSSHQSSSPNTLTLNISEETPMMTLSQSPATPEHPAHISPLDAEHKAARQDEQSEQWPAIVLYAIIKEVPLRRWKEFLRLLSVADQQLERVELEAGLGLGSMERQYQMLRLWSQRPSASLNDVFSALHYMDLSGCAQLLQESLEKLQ